MFDKDKKPELTSEERLKMLMKNQVENKTEVNKAMTSSAGSQAESYLVFLLLCSLNEGNSGMFHDRPKMAQRQVEELSKLGYDVNQIYNTLFDLRK